MIVRISYNSYKLQSIDESEKRIIRENLHELEKK